MTTAISGTCVCPITPTCPLLGTVALGPQNVLGDRNACHCWSDPLSTMTTRYMIPAHICNKTMNKLWKAVLFKPNFVLEDILNLHVLNELFPSQRSITLWRHRNIWFERLDPLPWTLLVLKTYRSTSQVKLESSGWAFLFGAAWWKMSSCACWTLGEWMCNAAYKY